MVNIRETLLSAEIDLPGQALEQLIIYHQKLIEWNKVMDLTNVKEEEMPLRHYADSLLPLYRRPEFFGSGAKIIDVGTGAGLPGVPIAIARPDFKVTLLDAQRKRCDFLQDVIETAGIKNAAVVHLRAEDGGRSAKYRESFDIALARAVAPLNVLLEYLAPFVKVGGTVLALKGPGVQEELKSALGAAKLLGCGRVEVLELMLCDMRHTLAAAKKIQKTLPQYPRKSGTPSKKPLGNIE